MADQVNIVAPEDLKIKLISIVERIEEAEADAKEAKQIVKDLYTEAKSYGLNKKALKAVIKLRRMEANTRNELEFEMEKYTAILESGAGHNGDSTED